MMMVRRECGGNWRNSYLYNFREIIAFCICIFLNDGMEKEKTENEKSEIWKIVMECGNIVERVNMKYKHHNGLFY